MKSFSLDQSTHFIDTVQVLNLMNQQNIHQLNQPQKISKNILKEFEKRQKKIRIITEDGRSYMTHIISVNNFELVLRLPDALNIRFSNHVLLVFPSEGKDYVVQGFVKKIFLPIVVLSYADPRFGKRWKLEANLPLKMFPVADEMLDRFMKQTLKLIRRSDVIRPGASSDPPAQKTNEAPPPLATLAIEDVICSEVDVDPEPDDEKNVMVFDYEEVPDSDATMFQNDISGYLHDISPSGIAMLAKKGTNPGQAGGLVYLEFQDLLSRDRKAELQVFKLRLFGIVRYQRAFNAEGEQIFGIKFVKTIDDARFINFLEKTGDAPT